MSHPSAASPPLPRQQWLSLVCRYLDHEVGRLRATCELVRQLAVAGINAPLDPGLLQQAIALGTELDALQFERECVLNALRSSSRQPHTHKLSEFPWSADERAALDLRRLQVRQAAAELSGVTLAARQALVVWGDVLGSLLHVLTGVSPHEATYTAHGARAPASPWRHVARAS